MKRYLPLALIGLLMSGIVHAAQQDITTITSGTGTSGLTIKQYNDNQINPRLTAIDENFDALWANRPWIAQATAPADTTLLWFDTDQVAGSVVLKVYTGGVWVAQAVGADGTYTLPAATIADLGGVKQGTGVSIAADGTLSVTASGLGLGTSDNPSFLSVHASGGNLAAANKQVTKAWQTGLDYTANVTSVIHGGNHYIATSNHTAGSTTEPGVGASWATVWTVASGEGGSMTWPASAGIMVYGGSSTYGTSLVADGDAIGELIVVHDDGEGGAVLPFAISYNDLLDPPTIPADVGDLTDTGGLLDGGGHTNLTEFTSQNNWRLFYSNGSGDVIELPMGEAGTVLKSNGTAAAPSWQPDETSGTSDTTPNSFTFTDETGVALSTAKVSNAITVAGTTAAAAISVTGDTGYGFSKNSAACTATSSTVDSGDTVSACVTSSASNSTTTSATITIGGVSDTYSVTTLASGGGPAPGTLLLGNDNTSIATDESTFSADTAYAMTHTAQESATVATAYFYDRLGLETTPVKVCIWDASGTLLGCSGGITMGSSPGWRSVAWSGPTVVQSTSYRIGVVPSTDGAWTYQDNSSPSIPSCPADSTDQTYASPGNLDNATCAGTEGSFRIYVTN